MTQDDELLDVTQPDLMAEIIREIHQLPIMRPDDVTSSRLAAAAGISEHTARRLLEKKVAAGLLIVTKCRDGKTNAAVRVYRRK